MIKTEDSWVSTWQSLGGSQTWKQHDASDTISDPAAASAPAQSPVGGREGGERGEKSSTGWILSPGAQKMADLGRGVCLASVSKLNVFLSKLSAGCHLLHKYSEEDGNM